MRVTAVNGSPRSENNTATLLRCAMDGARAAGAQAELIHLREVDFRGCVSCFGCKLKGNENPSRCVVRDGLAPVVDKVLASDVLLLGSPIYMGEVTSDTRAFIERLLFPLVSYDEAGKATASHNIRTAVFFTMNMPERNGGHFEWMFRNNTGVFSRFLGGSAEYLASYDTWQFDDYSRYAAAMFDVKAKAQAREERFSNDCRTAFEMGERLAAEVGRMPI